MNAKILTLAILPLLSLASVRGLAAPANSGHAGAAHSTSAPPAGGSTIIGSEEMPRGMVIMPWRSARPESFKPRPTRVLDEPLTPIAPRIFRREVHYYEHLHADNHSINRDETNRDH